jgi:ppGpp synthetase/RelA/SpoT-type nucleotidyltranferase
MNEILTDFDSKKELLSGFANTTHQLLKDLLSNINLNPHQITFRVKERDSLEKKIKKKDDKYNSLSEITDLVGFRIIAYFEDDIDKVAELIEKEFNIDKENSIDKRKLETDKFGYRSLHFVLSLKNDRLKLSEYKNYKDLKAEVQIRSILQHSWAEIEHDLGYKGEIEIPETAKRTFYRVAALLEQADIEFVKLKMQISNYEKEVENQINNSPETVSIDKASLLSFIKTNKTLNDLEAKVTEKLIYKRGEVNDFIITYSLPRLENLQISSIKQLEDSIKKNNDKIYLFIENFIKVYEKKYKKRSEVFVNGASISWLCSVLEDEKNH